MACRTGCPTQDHASWGECAREAHISAQWLGGTGVSLTGMKRWDADNEYYAQAVKDGLNPEGVHRHQVDAAYEAASKE